MGLVGLTMDQRVIVGLATIVLVFAESSERDELELVLTVGSDALQDLSAVFGSEFV